MGRSPIECWASSRNYGTSNYGWLQIQLLPSLVFLQ